HQKQRPWYKLEADMHKKWVCIASCPCTIQVDTAQGLDEILAVLRSRNQDQLAKNLQEGGSGPSAAGSGVSAGFAAGAAVGAAAPEEEAMEQPLNLQKDAREAQKQKERELEEAKHREREAEKEREREREREREKEKAMEKQREQEEREKEKEKERQKEKVAPTQSKAAPPVKDTKSMSKIRRSLEKENIDFEDL
ncbi:unnamed protein product, partial [Symbiodinium pilosum]